MIVKDYGKYGLECDFCGKYVSGFEVFGDAVAYAEENDWDKGKEGEEWINMCPDCM